MNPKELKKILKSVSLASLIVAGGVTLGGCGTTGKSSCSSCAGKGDKDKTQAEEGKTSCSGKTSGSDEGKTACSGMTSCG